MNTNDIQLSDISADIRAGFQALVNQHAYPMAFQATLGNGLGKVVVPNPDVPGLVYFRADSQTNAGDIGQAIQAPWLPMQDSVGGVSFDGLPVMIGKLPAIHGGKDRLYVVANNTTLAALSAAGGNQIIYQIISQTNALYQTVQVNGTALTQEKILNLIAGVAMTLVGADDSGNNRSNVTINGQIWAPLVDGEVPPVFIQNGDGTLILYQMY